MIEEKLKFLGFTEYEIKTYLTLIKKGKLKAYEIVKEANISSGKIYETLNNLERKGLIAIIPEKVKYYSPKPIQVIINLVQKKEKELEELKKELNELKTIEESRDIEPIIVVRGKKEFHKILKEIPYPKEYDYAIKWQANTIDMNIQKDTKYLIDNNVDLKILYDYDAPKENIKEWEKLIPNYKFIKSDKVALEVSESHLLISLANSNSTILIKSKELSEVLKQLFEAYYEKN